MAASRATKLLFVTLLLMFLILPLGNVGAVRPDKVVDEYFEEGELVAVCEGFDSGDFEVLVDSDYKVTTTYHYYRDGSLREIQIHFAISNGQLYDSLDPQIKYREGPDRAMFRIDPETGIIAESGLAFHFNVPGHGIVAIDAGRAILNPDLTIIWERGPHMFFEGELEPLCEFMAAD